MEALFQSLVDHFQKELSTIQVGRVSPSLLDDVMVEAYGTLTPVTQLATVTSQGAQMLLIQPWDHSILKELEKALRTCGRDYNPAVDGTTIRLPFPPLTEEKRKLVVKQVHEKMEATKVQVKLARENKMNDLKKQKADGNVSEDELFAQQKEIQKQVDEANRKLADIVKAKEADLMKL